MIVLLKWEIFFSFVSFSIVAFKETEVPKTLARWLKLSTCFKWKQKLNPCLSWAPYAICYLWFVETDVMPIPLRQIFNENAGIFFSNDTNLDPGWGEEKKTRLKSFHVLILLSWKNVALIVELDLTPGSKTCKKNFFQTLQVVFLFQLEENQTKCIESVSKVLIKFCGPDSLKFTIVIKFWFISIQNIFLKEWLMCICQQLKVNLAKNFFRTYRLFVWIIWKYFLWVTKFCHQKLLRI